MYVVYRYGTHRTLGQGSPALGGGNATIDCPRSDNAVYFNSDNANTMRSIHPFLLFWPARDCNRKVVGERWAQCLSRISPNQTFPVSYPFIGYWEVARGVFSALARAGYISMLTGEPLLRKNRAPVMYSRGRLCGDDATSKPLTKETTFSLPYHRHENAL